MHLNTQKVLAGMAGIDESLENPSFRLAVDRLEELDILHRFRDGFGRKRICLTPRARNLSKEDLIREMIEA